jgi:hypothetical protein
VSSGDIENVYNLQMNIGAVIDDVGKRAKTLLEKYPERLPTVPSLQEIRVIDRFYKIYNGFMDLQTDVIDSVVRLDLVITQLDDIREERLSRDLSNDIRELRAFKTWLESKLEMLKTYKSDLMQVRYLISDRLKLLQGLLYRSDTKGV